MTTATAQIQGYGSPANAVSTPTVGQAQACLAATGCERLKNKLAAYMASKGIKSKVALARHLGISSSKVFAWLNGSKFPPSKYARKLVDAGVLTVAELATMRPPRKPRVRTPASFVRGIRVYSLAEYAARG